MENSANTSSKVFGVIYALLAVFAGSILLTLVFEQVAFTGFRNVMISAISGITFLVCAAGAWVKWNDNVSYKYETSYKTSAITKVFKILFGSYAISLALFMVFAVLGHIVLGGKYVDSLIFDYSGVFFIVLMIVSVPFVRKYMK